MIEEQPGPVHLRPARPGDAAGLGACHVACWREAYAHLLSPAFLAALDVEDHTQRWQRGLNTPGEHVLLVAVAGDQVVGFAMAGPSPDDPPVRHWALRALYLRAAQHGTGVGQALLNAAIGDRPCAVWVAEDNPRARAFYARNGFRPDGARLIDPRMEDLAEIRLLR